MPDIAGLLITATLVLMSFNIWQLHRKIDGITQKMEQCLNERHDKP